MFMATFTTDCVLMRALADNIHVPAVGAITVYAVFMGAGGKTRYVPAVIPYSANGDRNTVIVAAVAVCVTVSTILSRRTPRVIIPVVVAAFVTGAPTGASAMIVSTLISQTYVRHNARAEPHSVAMCAGAFG